jgi:hypothetical protein
MVLLLYYLKRNQKITTVMSYNVDAVWLVNPPTTAAYEILNLIKNTIK